MFIDQGFVTEIGSGQSNSLKHEPAILAGRIILTKCVSGADWKLKEVHLDAPVILAQDAPDATSHIGGRLAPFNRALGSASSVTPQPFAKIRRLAYVDTGLATSSQFDQINAGLVGAARKAGDTVKPGGCSQPVPAELNICSS